MKDFRRLATYLLVAVLAVLLWNTWMHDYPPKPVAPAETNTVTTENNQSSLTEASSPPTFHPSTVLNKTDVPVKSAATKLPQKISNAITVQTDVINAKINPENGDLISIHLLKYPVSLKEKNKPVQILNPDPEFLYEAQSGLMNVDQEKKEALNFTASQKNYELKPGQDELIVSLTAKTKSGLMIVKTYTFKRNDYAIALNMNVKNTGGKAWTGSLFTQLLQRRMSEASSHFYTRSYVGASMSTPEIPYQKVPYKKLDEERINQTVPGGWIAFQQHYFLSAWIPGVRKKDNHYYSQMIEPNDGSNAIYQIGVFSPAQTLKQSQATDFTATLYVGPEIAKYLQALAPGLDHTIDYGWLFPISVLIFWVLSLFHQLIGNWGWAIVFTTILIKIGFYWFSAKSFRSMAKMRELQPKLNALKERYGDNRQEMSKATMELYKKEKVNPLGGCLPMLIQIPVFIALYYVLIESVQLRQAPFIFWIHDLSVKDPYYVLPILMGISMLVQQKLTPSPDPSQAKMMMFMPVVFTVFFINFPAGLVLYWFVNNCVQVLQQWYVMKTHAAYEAKKKSKRRK